MIRRIALPVACVAVAAAALATTGGSRVTSALWLEAEPISSSALEAGRLSLTPADPQVTLAGPDGGSTSGTSTVPATSLDGMHLAPGTTITVDRPVRVGLTGTTIDATLTVSDGATLISPDGRERGRTATVSAADDGSVWTVRSVVVMGDRAAAVTAAGLEASQVTRSDASGWTAAVAAQDLGTVTPGSDASGSDESGSDTGGSDEAGSDESGAESAGSDSSAAGSTAPGQGGRPGEPGGSDAGASDASSGGAVPGSDASSSDGSDSGADASDPGAPGSGSAPGGPGDGASDESGSDASGSDNPASGDSGSDGPASDGSASDGSGPAGTGSDSSADEPAGSDVSATDHS